MTEEQFKTLKNFGFKEFDIKKRLITKKLKNIKSELMFQIDYNVSLIKSYYKNVIFKVIDINLGQHTKNSLHYIGEAIDGFFYDTKLKIILPVSIQYYYIHLGGFKGIGVYPEHKYPGIHADIRNQQHISIWYGYYNYYKNGKRIQKYEYNREKIRKTINKKL